MTRLNGSDGGNAERVGSRPWVMAAMIRRIYPAKHLGRGLGLNNVVGSVSGALAPTAGGLILALAPWPWVFAMAAPFAVLSLALGRWALPDVPARPGAYNLAGAMLNIATFGLIIAGLEALVRLLRSRFQD